MDSLLDYWQPRLIALASTSISTNTGTSQDDDGAHDLNHLHRVWRNATLLLAQHEEADTLVVLAACYLHDLVNLPKNHPERHLASRQAAALATRELAARDFPAERLAAVAHAIACHSFSAALPAHTIEAQIVQDADRLDALGAVGLARLFYIAGRMGSSLAHSHDPLARNRERDDRAYALDHIETKLATLPGKMHTPTGRRLGLERLAELLAFRDRFVEQWS